MDQHHHDLLKLADQGLLEQADVTILREMFRSGLSFDLVRTYTRLAQRANEWPEATARAERLLQLFPDRAEPYALLAQSLRRAGQQSRSMDVAAEGARRYPGSIDIVIERAVASAPDWQSAADHWRVAVALQPIFAGHYARLGFSLRRLGDHAAATAVLKNALARFPDEKPLVVELIEIAQIDRVWQDIIQWSTYALRLTPGDEKIQRRLAEARFALASERASRGLPEIVAVHDADSLDAALASRFQSVGQNCEFGFVQRRMGCEPLGLLRWSAITAAALIEALDQDLYGIGDPDYTVIDVHLSEYMTSDTRWGMRAHTFVEVGQVDYDIWAEQQRRRLNYLSRRLLEDLEDGQKILVFVAYDKMSEEQARSLLAAVRRHGTCRLLIVHEASDGGGAGTLRDAGGGLMFGVIDRIGHTNAGWNISFESWRTVLEQAAQLTTDTDE